jgi:hypothetical protein
MFYQRLSFLSRVSWSYLIDGIGNRIAFVSIIGVGGQEGVLSHDNVRVQLNSIN